MKHIASACRRWTFLLAVGLLAGAAAPERAIADSNQYTVVGRAHSVQTETVFDDLGNVVTTKYFIQKVQKTGGGFTEIVQVCVPGFDPTNCTASYLLGNCSKTTTNYGPHFIGNRTIFGSIVTCNPVNTGRCASSSGRLISKDLPQVDLVSAGSGCQF